MRKIVAARAVAEDPGDRLRRARAARAPPRPASGSPQAADVLAMAPETNIGSSTPINGNGSNIGSDLRRKVVNDAAASLRGLAKSHGRNAAVGRRRGPQGVEPDRGGGAADERDRPDLAVAAGPAATRSTAG